ncbi:MAG: GNAT family N-acetyltransferase [Gemmatimonadaceae bacterium]
MTDFRIELHEHPDEREARAVIDGLLAFNRNFIGDPNETPLAVIVRDADGRVVGGLLGHVRWQWAYVSKLWLPDELRGRGMGTQLMQKVESYARAKGCHGIHLDTFEYQALPFYEKLGYELFGTLDGYPPGYRQFHLKKALRSG